MNITRRNLLKGTLAAAPFVIAPHVLGQNGAVPPSETVRLGVIGLGGRANYLFNRTFAQARGCQIVSVCDIFEERLNKFQQKYPEKYT
ncbi:MAG: hypothetical protein E7028_11400, partial [Planctomycetaceae bacterium]|nr:hypothetical protein [Planctomycetaceae bacterium]